MKTRRSMEKGEGPGHFINEVIAGREVWSKPPAKVHNGDAYVICRCGAQTTISRARPTGVWLANDICYRKQGKPCLGPACSTWIKSIKCCLDSTFISRPQPREICDSMKHIIAFCIHQLSNTDSGPKSVLVAEEPTSEGAQSQANTSPSTTATSPTTVVVPF